MTSCAYCGAPATTQIPASPGEVCRAHADEFWTGLLSYAKNQSKASENAEPVCVSGAGDDKSLVQLGLVTAKAGITARPLFDPRKHIVMVDDDTAVLSVLARMLADYRVSAARSADEALYILTTHEPVDLLITDYLMPGITGEELAARARELRPHLPVLFVTAHASAVAQASAVFAAELHLAKPVEMAVLKKTVMNLIGPALPPMMES